MAVGVDWTLLADGPVQSTLSDGAVSAVQWPLHRAVQEGVTVLTEAFSGGTLVLRTGDYTEAATATHGTAREGGTTPSGHHALPFASRLVVWSKVIGGVVAGSKSTGGV